MPERVHLQHLDSPDDLHDDRSSFRSHTHFERTGVDTQAKAERFHAGFLTRPAREEGEVAIRRRRGSQALLLGDSEVFRRQRGRIRQGSQRLDVDADLWRAATVAAIPTVADRYEPRSRAVAEVEAKRRRRSERWLAERADIECQLCRGRARYRRQRLAQRNMRCHVSATVALENEAHGAAVGWKMYDYDQPLKTRPKRPSLGSS